MSFFDSAKNRAIWERRLSGLRQEKERRRETGYMPQETAAGVSARSEENPYRRRITLKELEAQVMEQSGVRRVKRPGREMRAARERMQEKGLEKQGREL